MILKVPRCFFDTTGICSEFNEMVMIKAVMDDTKDFLKEKKARIASYSKKTGLLKAGRDFLIESLKEKYSYNFNWLGLPIFQYPQDMVLLQEIIWKTRPDLIIETGIARGGSLIFYASLLEMIGNNGIIAGIDIDLREHNKTRILAHPLSHRIRFIEASSIGKEAMDAVNKLAMGKENIMVVLDSNHTHDHVLKELELYTPFVSPGCYCIVFDTIIEDMAAGSYPDRPWDKGDNPKTAVDQFLRGNTDFYNDGQMELKAVITAAKGGFLVRRI